MDPEVWGPHGWIFLHTITLNYPKNPTIYDKQNYKTFFTSLQNILPCDWCSKNYKLHLKKFPIDKYLNCKKDLVQWLIHIHNEVNKIFNKKIISYQEFVEIYKNIYNSKKNINFHIIIHIISIILIIILIILCIYFNNPKFQSYFHFLHH